MPSKPAIACACGRVRQPGAACACGAGDTARRKLLYDAKRGSASERGYGSKWRQAREGFLKAHPKCTRCGKPATVVNHRQPHKGDKALFWSRSNWEAVCAPCHNGPIQSQERRSPPGSITSSRSPGDRREGLLPISLKLAVFPEGSR